MWTTFEYVRCGNRRCRACPHGPYRYDWFRVNGRKVKRYVGRVLGGISGSQSATQDNWDAIFNRRTATRAIAMAILGIKRCPSQKRLKAWYWLRATAEHPEAEGDAHHFAQISAAYSFLKA